MDAVQERVAVRGAETHRNQRAQIKPFAPATGLIQVGDRSCQEPYFDAAAGGRMSGG